VIPDGVEVTISGPSITVKGPKGELARRLPDEISISKDDGVLKLARSKEARETRALHGLFRSLVANMVEGVTKGFEKTLEIHGVGYRASKQGNDIELSVGFSHTVRKAAPPGIDFDVPQPTRIVVRGIDKELVGQIASEIRAVRKPEPYKAKGIRYEGEHVRRKSGKAAKTGAM
jgi:large subunit ribosomal protein L6